MATYERLWFPIGDAKDEDARSGSGAYTRRYVKIIYEPPGESDEPAVVVRHLPHFSSGLTVPAVKIEAGALSQGDAVLIDKATQTGAFVTGVYRGEEQFSIEGDGDSWFAGYLYSKTYLQLLEQNADPPNVIIDVAEIWVSDGTDTGDAGDGYVKIHQGGDPGANKIIQLWDYSAGTLGGLTAVVWNTFADGDETPDVSAGHYFKTNNSSPTTLKNFDNAPATGHWIIIWFGDSNTSIEGQVNFTLMGNGPTYGPLDAKDLFWFGYDSTDWIEWNRHINS